MAKFVSLIDDNDMIKVDNLGRLQQEADRASEKLIECIKKLDETREPSGIPKNTLGFLETDYKAIQSLLNEALKLANGVKTGLKR